MAQLLLRTVTVQQIVLQLEGQPKFVGKTVELAARIIVSSADQRPDVCGSSHQNGRLQLDHADILLDGHVVTILEIHIVLLPLENLHRRIVEDLENFRQQLCRGFLKQVISVYQHGIAREYGDILIPLSEYRRFAPTDRSVVHDVVMQKGEVVEKLQGRRTWHSLVGLVREDPARQKCQHRSDTLAALLHRVADRCVKLGWFSAQLGLGQIVLYLLQKCGKCRLFHLDTPYVINEQR